jgi:hypothetical protein
MALLQALLTFLGRSARRAMNSIFGWAVVALFGRSGSGQQTALTILVAMAALWPLLVLGIAFPKVITFVVAFVPVLDDTAGWILRAVWIALALAVPAIIGLVIAKRAPGATRAEPFFVRVLRGFPITLGIAAAFALMFFVVPALRIASAVRRRKDHHVPLITTDDEYEGAAEVIDVLLERHGHDAVRARPPWWLALPARILRKLGGKVLDHYVPEQVAYWKGPDLEIALYPSDLLLRGEPHDTARAHGLLDEAFAPGPGLMTYDEEAQRIEKEIQDVWRTFAESPRAHTGARGLLARHADIARDIGRLEVEYEPWQVVYRKALQLGRALRGEPQLLQKHARTRARRTNEVTMVERSEKPLVERSLAERPLADTPLRALMGDAVRLSRALAKTELELLRAEVRSDLRREVSMAKAMSIGAVCLIVAVTLLLTAAALALAAIMSAWLAALLIGGVVLAIGLIFALVGWSRRVKQPLEKTRRTLQDTRRWLKGRVA